jgi:hypothetical protein
VRAAYYESMSTVVRQELHLLVDSLPEAELEQARKYLLCLGDDQEEPESAEAFADMPREERERLHAVLRESRAQHAEGLGIPSDEAMRRLRSR